MRVISINILKVRIPNKDGVTLERNHPLPALPCITPFKGRGDYDIDRIMKQMPEAAYDSWEGAWTEIENLIMDYGAELS